MCQLLFISIRQIRGPCLSGMLYNIKNRNEFDNGYRYTDFKTFLCFSNNFMFHSIITRCLQCRDRYHADAWITLIDGYLFDQNCVF
jgi:hypothetical protein